MENVLVNMALGVPKNSLLLFKVIPGLEAVYCLISTKLFHTSDF